MASGAGSRDAPTPSVSHTTPTSNITIGNPAEPKLTLESIPSELQQHLLAFMGPRELLSIRGVSKQFRGLVDHTAGTLLARLTPIAVPSADGCSAMDALLTIKRWARATTFAATPATSRHFAFHNSGRTVEHVSQSRSQGQTREGFVEIRGSEALPRGSGFTFKLCPREASMINDTMFELHVGAVGTTSGDAYAMSSEPSTRLVRKTWNEWGSPVLVPIATAEEYGGAAGRRQWCHHDTIRVQFDRTGAISFGINGVDLGVAFEGGADTRPAFEGGEGVGDAEIIPWAQLYVSNSIEFTGDLELF